MQYLEQRKTRLSVGRAALSGALAAALVLAAAVPVRAVDTPRELRERADANMAQGNFVEAIPDMHQLINLLEDSDKSHIIRWLEPVYYQVGVAHFFLGEFSEAETSLRTYMREYPRGAWCKQSAVYIADSLRLRGELEKALKAYEVCLRNYNYDYDWRCDIFCAMARCHLADGQWADAVPYLKGAYKVAPDFLRRNWAATMLTTAYLKDLDLDRIYPLVPYLLRPNSLASRSIAYNMAALEAGDIMFSDDKYRDALWVYRLVYSHDLIAVRTEEYLEKLQRQAERVRKLPGDPRRLMRIQESIAELEAELEALTEIENYDIELHYRIGRSYKELRRYREGREVFFFLYEQADPELAEEALYLAFECSVNVLPLDRAFEIGKLYMEEYPNGLFFDPLTLVMGQLYAREENWPEVIRHLTETLQISPNHESGAECMLLLGYACFMEERFQESVGWLRKLLQRYPASERVPEATYWCGMALMFDTNYEEAAVEFDRVLERFPNSEFVESSAYRRAVCDYGMGLFEDSDRRLALFIEAYPQSVNTPEALMMRGDIGGALGNLKEAVTFYQQAMSHDGLNMEYYNHCAFQSGRILYEEELFDELQAHFETYIDRHREGSNIPLAIYWVGRALWHKGEQEGALRYYRTAVKQFGADRTAVGIDLILDEWIHHTRRADPEAGKRAWEEFRASLKQSKEEGNRVMLLRLLRVMQYDPELGPIGQSQVVQALLREDNLRYASPAVLQAMLDLSLQNDKGELAEKAAAEILTAFKETDYALDARMVLARRALEQAKQVQPAQADALYMEALRHLGVISEVYAASGEAGEAKMLMGRIYQLQGRYGEADEAFKEVLGVRGWRNLWPEALYLRGECAFSQREYEVASAFYERIYLLYSHYADWVAKAYLRRAECLRRAFQDGKAREVLTRMLSDASLSEFPETTEARKMLKELGGST